MKKISALIISVLMVCSVFTACGDTDSSSAKDSASSSVSASASDKGGKPVYDDENTLAKQYTDKLQEGNFSLVMTNSMAGSEPMELALCGNDLHMKMSVFGISMNVYVKDGVGYMVDENEKVYATQDASSYSADQIKSQTMGISDNYKFVGRDTADGLICETYEVAMTAELEEGVELIEDSETDEAANKQIYKYYFDENTGDLKKIDTEAFGMTSTTEIISFETGITEIAMPDGFDSYTEISAEEFSEKMSAGVDTDALGDTFGVEEGEADLGTEEAE